MSFPAPLPPPAHALLASQLVPLLRAVRDPEGIGLPDDHERKLAALHDALTQRVRESVVRCP